MKTLCTISLPAILLTAGLALAWPQVVYALEDREELGEHVRHNIWSFGQDEVGSVPKGWKVAETGGEGKLAAWQVVTDESAPSPTHVVAITANKNYGRTFNLLMAKGTRYKDLEIAVMVKAVAGQDDQGGGPIWRARNADNYYICRWNPLEDNFIVYYVKNGRRRRLASAKVKTDRKVWHRIEIKHKGTEIEAQFDGTKLIELEDSTFTEAGMVGLWVKADGRSEFDDIKVLDLSGESMAESEQERGLEQEVSLSEVPAAVLRAANNAITGGKITGVEKKREAGVVLYEVKRVVKGVDYEIDIAADGTLRKVSKKEGHESEESDDD